MRSKLAAQLYVQLRKKGFGRFYSLMLAVVVANMVHEASSPMFLDLTVEDIQKVIDALEYAKIMQLRGFINSQIYMKRWL